MKPRHWKRYRDVAWLLMKYGRSDLVKQAGLDEALQDETAPEPASETKDLAADLEKMGPTFIKLGQLLSTRADLLPEAYLVALARLQDQVQPFPFEEVERTISTELGVRISKAFLEFDATPIAAASLGQVHRARLRDGRLVAVKVQRPGIRKQVVEDIEALAEIAAFVDAHTEVGRRYEFRHVVDQFHKSLMQELDYRQEARNLELIGRNLQEFEAIVVPAPVDSYSTSVVLTMEYVLGKKITSIGPLRKLELQGAELNDQLFRAYLKQILIDGVFHADPHPGNVFLTDDDRIALLDLGMVARTTPELQEKLIHLLLAISDNRAEEAAEISMTFGEPREDVDKRRFRTEVAEVVSHRAAPPANVEVGKTILEIARVAGMSGFPLPPELTMLGKTLLNLDHVARTLDPAFDPNAAIRRHAAAIVQQRMAKSLSPGNLFSGLLETKDFFEKLPRRVGKIMDTLANNELELKIDAIDEHRLMEGFQKVANRITMGLILAALIVGAAMLMDVPTSFRILGYPGLAMLCFLGAAGGGVALMLSILYHDSWGRKR